MEESQATPSGNRSLRDVEPSTCIDDGTTQLVRANDDAKDPVAQYHVYRRHFVFFRMSRHAFLEIKSDVRVEGLEKVIGMCSFHHMYTLVVDMMRCGELLVGGTEAQRHPEISKLSLITLLTI